MKIVVLAGSPNKRGSTNLLVDHFRRGAEEAGHRVEIIDAAHAAIHPCTGPRIHVASTGQVKDFHLLYHFMHDVFNKRYLLVGCVGKDTLEKLRKLEEHAKFLRPIVTD